MNDILLSVCLSPRVASLSVQGAVAGRVGIWPWLAFGGVYSFVTPGLGQWTFLMSLLEVGGQELSLWLFPSPSFLT